jgi:hypothetical protein
MAAWPGFFFPENPTIMPRSKQRSGQVSRRTANAITLAVVVVVLMVGIWLLVRAMNYGDVAASSVN